MIRVVPRHRWHRRWHPQGSRPRRAPLAVANQRGPGVVAAWCLVAGRWLPWRARQPAPALVKVVAPAALPRHSRRLVVRVARVVTAQHSPQQRPRRPQGAASACSAAATTARRQQAAARRRWGLAAAAPAPLPEMMPPLDWWCWQQQWCRCGRHWRVEVSSQRQQRVAKSAPVRVWARPRALALAPGWHGCGRG